MTTIATAPGRAPDLAQILTLRREAPAACKLAFEYHGPVPLVAGALDRWRYRLVSRAAIAAGARIAIAHRWPSDWGTPQGADRGAMDFLEVRSSAAIPLRWWSARLHTWHPFDHVLFVEIDAPLAPGQDLTLAFGGDAVTAGFRVQSFAEEGSPFSIRLREREGEAWAEIAEHRIAIVGSAPARLVAVAPSRAVDGEEVTLRVRIEDAWGNPASLPAPVAIAITTPRGEGRHATIGSEAMAAVPIGRLPRGITRLAVTAPTLGLSCETNPVECVTGDAPHRVYWGDLHAQSIIGCGARTIDAYYAHARDFAALDVCSHQANCFLVSGPEWDDTIRSSLHNHRPGKFVTLLGFEWSAASALGGDHNVYFAGDEGELRRCSHEFVVDRSDLDTDLSHVEDFYRYYAPLKPLVAVHVGGRTANLKWHDATLERLLEIHSTHATSEWFLREALARGYRMGVIAGSDSVDGRPGNSHPGRMGVRNVRGGLTAIVARALTREAVWDALTQRHCYATTGARILLDVRFGDAMMGDDTAVPGGATPIGPFAIHVEGTAGIERIDFFRDDVCIAHTDRLATPPTRRLRVAWRGASAPGNWQRARMRWDGSLRIEGPTMAGVAAYGFDTPAEGVIRQDGASVAWESVTAGDWDGVVLDLGGGDGEIVFVTEPISARVPLRDIGPQGYRIDLASPERSLELRWLPETAPSSSASIEFTDPTPRGGTHAYWIRVRQADGEFAWSTPIFVTMPEPS